MRPTRGISNGIGRLLGSAVAGLAMMLVAGPAGAVPIISSPTGLAVATTSLTFDEIAFANNTTITNQYQSYGVSFTPSLRYNPQLTAFPNITGGRLGNFNPIIDPFFIDFSGRVSDAAFAMVTNPGTSTFTALLDGAIVESFSVATHYNSALDYYGFSGIIFDQIRVDVGGSNSAMLLDNLQFVDVPEPASLVLFALALGGLGFMARRRVA